MRIVTKSMSIGAKSSFENKLSLRSIIAFIISHVTFDASNNQGTSPLLPATKFLKIFIWVICNIVVSMSCRECYVRHQTLQNKTARIFLFPNLLRRELITLATWID